MPRTVTIELTDDQAEILDALAAGTGIEPAALLIKAAGQGLAMMIHEVEHFGPSDETYGPDGPPLSAPYQHRPPSKANDLDDGLPF